MGREAAVIVGLLQMTFAGRSSSAEVIRRKRLRVILTMDMDIDEIP